VFALPSSDGCNKLLDQWIRNARIDKYITWSCARLSFSILLQDKNVDDATVAYLLGHATTEQVRKTYKRHRPKDQSQSIGQLPTPEQTPYFLNVAS
jgi:integrase